MNHNLKMLFTLSPENLQDHGVLANSVNRMAESLPGGMLVMSMEEYEHLTSRDIWLTCLERAGVSQWSGHALALKYQAEFEQSLVEEAAEQDQD